jgi:malonate decarboxylase delta subunit
MLEMPLCVNWIESFSLTGSLREEAPTFSLPQSFSTAWSLTEKQCRSPKGLGRTRMEQIEFDHPAANRRITRRAHVGVVGSGDMEVLIEPSAGEGAQVTIITSVNGFQDTWKAVFDRFFSRFDRAVQIYINDAGATPGSVLLRLEQAVEVIEQ